MISKGIKYFKSIIRIGLLKIKYGKKLNIEFNIKDFKSLYIGKNVNIIIRKDSQLNLGKRVYISDYCKLECDNGEITIGNNTFLNESCKIVSLNKIEIGKGCLFGENVSIYDHDHKYHEEEIEIRNQGFSIGEIIIKDNVWIGTNVVITKGVEINQRVVVGANSVVRGKLSSNSLYAGIPSRKIKDI
ncbi:acyltransferase [Clostridium saudiense]|nr:acyltransferase [Clostridium saudiense]